MVEHFQIGNCKFLNGKRLKMGAYHFACIFFAPSSETNKIIYSGTRLLNDVVAMFLIRFNFSIYKFAIFMFTLQHDLKNEGGSKANVIKNKKKTT